MLILVDRPPHSFGCPRRRDAMKTVAPRTAENEGRTRIIERPDGIYWRDEDGIEYGPFASLTDAMADRESAMAAEVEDLEEADGEFAIADWVDPDTGELAETSVPHIEDH
jgi:hypothetical protein